MKNIVLIGMMGCGKTTIGRLLSEAMGWEQVDTDQYIEEKEGCTIAEIFARHGEGYFRDLELEVTRELSAREDLIISCGGGLPVREECMKLLRATGLVFWLDRDPGATFDGLELSGRPLAQQGRDAFLERYWQRVPIYRKGAHFLVDCACGTELTSQHILGILAGQGVTP